MPIPIIIAILVALFTLGTKMNQPKTGRAEVVSVSSKQNDKADKKQNHDNLVEAAVKAEEEPAGKAQGQTEDYENIFQLWSLYKIIEPINAVNNSINQ
jgi:hypothetical protein